MRIKSNLFKTCLATLLLAGAVAKSNAATFTVDPGAGWLGYMNVFDLPSAGGVYRFGNLWDIPDLAATFSGPVLTLAPNSIGDPNSYWYTPSV